MTNNERYPFNRIHPTTLIAEGVEIGQGNTIGPYCIIGFPAEWKGHQDMGKVVIGNNNNITGLVTIDSGGDGKTMIGNDCWLLKHSHVGHNAVLFNGVTVSCGAKIGGHSILKSGVNAGLNCTVHQNVEIAEGCILGMGSVITKKLQTEPYKKYVGNPARCIGENINHPNYNTYKKDAL